jgi:hypothetical protein
MLNRTSIYADLHQDNHIVTIYNQNDSRYSVFKIQDKRWESCVEIHFDKTQIPLIEDLLNKLKELPDETK